VKLLAAIGFWGASGEHELTLYLDSTEKTTVATGRVNIPVLVEENDFLCEIPLIISSPGPAFLECRIDGQLLGRHALYFGSA